MPLGGRLLEAGYSRNRAGGETQLAKEDSTLRVPAQKPESGMVWVRRYQRRLNH
jgi:hypothetical protein